MSTSSGHQGSVQNLLTSQLFREEDFYFFGLLPQEVTSRELDKRFRQRCLTSHPDKPGGSNESFLDMKLRYDNLKAGFERFKVLQRIHPGLTIADVTGTDVGLQIPPTYKLAPRWHVQDIIDASPQLLSIEKALRCFPQDFFTVSITEVAEKLQQLRPEDQCIIYLRGVTQPTEDWDKKHHGSSWEGFKRILLHGFLPSFGAGRDAAYRDFGEDVPLVYLSPNPDVAKTYPHALMDATGDNCGEAVANDTIYLRQTIVCRVNPEKRRVKIRRGRHNWNKQDAYLVEDVQATAVTFHGMATAPPEQITHYHLEHRSIPRSVAKPAEAPPWIVERELRRIARTQCELMRLRRFPADDRTTQDLCDATLELLVVRSNFLLKRCFLSFDHILDEDQMKSIWNNDLKAAFLIEENEFAQTGPEPPKKTHKASHSRYSAWLSWAYGKKEQIRSLLREGVPQYVEDLLLIGCSLEGNDLHHCFTSLAR